MTVEVAPESVPELIQALQDAGFRLRLPEHDPDFVARTRVLPLVHSQSRLPLDLVLAGPGPEEGFLQRAVPVEAGGVSFPAIAAEDLLVVKTLAGRAKDLDDLEGILRRQGERLDREAVRARLRELEQMLDVSDLLPLFEQIASRASRG